MIKPINLSANTEVAINLVGGTHVNIENRGSGTVYVSKHANVVPNTDEVMSVDSGTSKAMRNVATYSIRENVADYYGTIYVVSDSDTSIEVTTANDLNFRRIEKGGDDKIISNLQTTIDSLTIQKLKTAEDSYSASYQLYKNEIAIGDKINIPKDLVVQSGSVKTVESENTPVEGYVVGDKYIDLVLANSNDGHIYILVSDLVEGVGEYYFINGIKKGEIFNDYAHNVASGEYSHSEGANTIASGSYSHSEGTDTTAKGNSSHAGGIGTIASGEAQTVVGKYNIEDTENKYAFIIGNGNSSSSTRSNVFSLSWDGSLIVDNIKNQLSDTLVEGLKYQLGVLTSDITLTLPETASSDIEVDFAVADTTYAINCDYLSLDVVSDTYYQIVFSYDKALSRWFASVVSSDYISTTTAEVLTDETT